MYRIRLALVGAVASVAMMVAATPASAQTNNQSGLVNVNVSNILVQIPASVAVPVSVAANVCNTNVNVLSAQLQNGPVTCTATSNSHALDTAVATAMTGGSGGGGGSNNQQGLVNVSLTNIKAQIPVSVALPIGVAANVCGTNANILAHQVQSGSANCNAQTTADAITRVLATA